MGERRQIGQRRRAERRETETVGPRAAEEARTEAEREGEAGRSEPERLARVGWRRVGISGRITDRLAAGKQGRGRAPAAQERLELAPIPGQDVKGGELDALLGG